VFCIAESLFQITCIMHEPPDGPMSLIFLSVLYCVCD